jgi:taurine dioxygenase
VRDVIVNKLGPVMGAEIRGATCCWYSPLSISMRRSRSRSAARPARIPTKARWCGIRISFQRRPALATILYGIEVPCAGGDTLYADMYSAYEGLDREMRQRAGELPMTAKQRAEAPQVEHPVVRTHPETGRKLLYISRHVSHFIGMPRSESDALLEKLLEHSIRDRFVFRHRWGQRDVVMWDNRCTMHCATPYDAGAERRVIHRTVVKGDEPR